MQTQERLTFNETSHRITTQGHEVVCVNTCSCATGYSVADPGGPRSPPPCPQDFFKIMQFSDHFKGKTPILSKFWAQDFPWGQNPAALPDQNPGSAPGIE